MSGPAVLFVIAAASDRKSPTSLPPRQSACSYRRFSGGHDARRELCAGLTCCEQEAFWAGRMSCEVCPTGSQRRSSEPSTGWFAFPVCSPFLRGRFAAPFFTGASRTRPVPLCRCATFPPLCGGIFPRPRRVSAARSGRRLVCAPLAHGALLKKLAKTLIFARLWLTGCPWAAMRFPAR